MNRQLQLWAPIQFVWLITRIVRVHAALGSQGVGFTLVAFVVGVTLGQWLKRHPTPLSTPGFVGVNRSGFLALIACVNTLTPAALISDTYDQAGMLLCIIAAVTYFTVILPGPPRGWKRKLNEVTRRVTARFAKPIMDGAPS